MAELGCDVMSLRRRALMAESGEEMLAGKIVIEEGMTVVRFPIPDSCKNFIIINKGVPKAIGEIMNAYVCDGIYFRTRCTNITTLAGNCDKTTFITRSENEVTITATNANTSGIFVSETEYVWIAW